MNDADARKNEGDVTNLPKASLTKAHPSADKRGMGKLIVLAERRAPLPAPDTDVVAFLDLGCALSYLTAERLERTPGTIIWRPVPLAGTSELQRLHAERLARSLRMPLSWPQHYGAEPVGLHRAAAWAGAHGAGPRFVLAALRLGFSGGFDLCGATILQEAAAAAGLSRRGARAAAGEPAWDAELTSTREELADRGILHGPVIQLGERWLSGEAALAAATTWTLTRARPRSS